MKTKSLLFFIITLIFIFGCSRQQPVSHPNIVFILADDMGYGDPSCYNPDSKIPTPNIDDLANHGIMFTDAHSPGAWCVPSRYGLLTGRYPGRAQMNWTERALIEDNQETLATLLRRHGYATACIGKWHLGFDNLNWEHPELMDELRGGPVEHGFDYFYGLHASLDIPPYFYTENQNVVQAPTGSVKDNQSPDPTSAISGAFWRGGKTAPDFKHNDVLDELTAKATKFLKQQHESSPEKPFFLYFPLTAPHTPWLPSEKFRGKSAAGEYGDFVMQVDEVLGSIMNILDELQLTENTLVIFTSDNGPVWFEADIEKFGHDSKNGLKGMKIDMWEGGSRIPFIASWPGKIPKGTRTGQLLCFTDMMATFGAIVNDSLNMNDFDSHNLLPVFLNPNMDNPVRNELVIQNKIYRNGRWKYIDGSGLGILSKRFDPDGFYIEEIDNDGELYNLEEDLNETKNLYDEDPDRVNSMKNRLEELLGQPN